MDESTKDRLIDFLLTALEETTTQAKAHKTALKVLCLGRDWQHQVSKFEQQLKPQIAAAFVQIRHSILEADQTLPTNWDDVVHRLIDSAHNPE